MSQQLEEKILTELEQIKTLLIKIVPLNYHQPTDDDEVVKNIQQAETEHSLGKTKILNSFSDLD